jgi:hypothetical protein
MMNWSWDQGWILAAVFMMNKDEGATLAEVIGAADMINHAIPTVSELSVALSKLSGSGVVQIRDGRYFIEAEHLASLTKAMKRKGGLFAGADKCLKWLRGAGLQGEPSAEGAVSAEDAKAAYDEYLQLLKHRPKR